MAMGGIIAGQQKSLVPLRIGSRRAALDARVMRHITLLTFIEPMVADIWFCTPASGRWWRFWENQRIASTRACAAKPSGNLRVCG